MVFLRENERYVWFWDESRLRIVRVPRIRGGMATPTMDQEDFQWFNDDGNEATSTSAAAINTNLTAVDLDGGNVDFQIRIVCKETGAAANNNYTDQFESDLNASATWESVTTTENGDGCLVVSTNLTDLGETTQRVGGGTFLTPNDGQSTDGSPGGTSCDFVGSDETEFVISIRFVAASLNDADTVDIRLRDVDTRTGANARIAFTKTAPATKPYYYNMITEAQGLH